MSHPHYDLDGKELPVSRLKRIKRSTAERLLAGVIERAKAYNADKTRLMWIDELMVFGSYLSNAETLGDLDIGVLFSKKPGWSAEKIVKQARKEKPWLNYYFAQLCHPETNLIQKLKNRSGYISIHYGSELAELRCKFEVVYSRFRQP